MPSSSWTKKEDRSLCDAVVACGHDWPLVAKYVASKSEVQCSERWAILSSRPTLTTKKKQDPRRSSKKRRLFDKIEDDALNYMDDGLSLFSEWIDTNDTTGGLCTNKSPPAQGRINFKIAKNVSTSNVKPMLRTTVSSITSTTVQTVINTQSSHRDGMSLVSSTEDGCRHIYKSDIRIAF